MISSPWNEMFWIWVWRWNGDYRFLVTGQTVVSLAWDMREGPRAYHYLLIQWYFICFMNGRRCLHLCLWEEDVHYCICHFMWTEEKFWQMFFVRTNILQTEAFVNQGITKMMTIFLCIISLLSCRKIFWIFS